MWAVFLIAGPSEACIRYVFTKVASVVTDHGTELQMLTVPDVNSAFVRWNDGWPLARCAPLVDSNERLFTNALRISGWCHAWGNLMKEVAHACPAWPRVEKQMRNMVTFYKNRTWRMWVKRALQERGVELDLTVLDSFPASMTKWRYETIANCMACLDCLRAISQGHLRIEMFANAQDKVLIKEVFEIAKDADFWSFISFAHRNVFQRCELCRHFGMVCNCEKHTQQREEARAAHTRYRSECVMNSRRLPEA